ncbi:hypothetical protein [Leifsonia soli]|uniref:Uncharacterized protein n=1 Tax=Leifsonia soli TaxID=582665 RepID=A0A852SZV6_9MICO|nr:hypothetical protein [Leifsonia soli]NYD74183.1 hypothetical protein [Leifsonia soli]
MDIEQLWPTLSEATRAWLIANNGDAVPEPVADEVVAAGGVLTEGSAEDDEDGLYLSDEETDWIEAVANGEG